MEALIDLDILLYRCSAAAQTRRYTVYDGTSRVIHGEFKYAKEAKQFAGNNPDFHTDFFIIPGDFSHAIHNFNVALESILENVNTRSFRLFGSDSTDNLFRTKLATIRPYKGNRIDADRPYFYFRLKEFVYERYAVHTRSGLEADDLLGIAQSYSLRARPDGSGTIICSTDKDLNQIPGQHYNFTENKQFYISPEDALYYFYSQLITGDSTDNIVGLPGKGEVFASKVISSYNLPPDEPSLQAEILSLYEEEYKDKGREVMIENGRLIKILTEPLEDDLSNLWKPNYV